MENIAKAVGGGFDDDLAVGGFDARGHGLEDAGQVLLGVREKGQFGDVGELDRGTTADGAGASGRCHAVAGIELIEDEFLGVRRASVRFDDLGHVFVKALDHAVEVVGGGLFVGDDQGAATEPVSGLMVQACRDIAGDAHLPGLEDDTADGACTVLLFLDLLVEIALGAVENEGVDCAAFCPYLEARLTVCRKIEAKALPEGGLVHWARSLWKARIPNPVIPGRPKLGRFRERGYPYTVCFFLPPVAFAYDPRRNRPGRRLAARPRHVFLAGQGLVPAWATAGAMVPGTRQAIGQRKCGDPASGWGDGTIILRQQVFDGCRVHIGSAVDDAVADRRVIHIGDVVGGRYMYRDSVGGQHRLTSRRCASDRIHASGG